MRKSCFTEEQIQHGVALSCPLGSGTPPGRNCPSPMNTTALLPTWRVKLEGEQRSLDLLPARISQSNATVSLDDGGGFFLESSAFDGLSDAADVYRAASKIVRALNAVALVELPGFRAAHPGAVRRYCPSEGESQFIVPEPVRLQASAATCTIRGDVIGADGKVRFDPTEELNAAVANVLDDPNLEEALLHFGASSISEVFKCFEVLEKHASQHLNAVTTKRARISFSERCQPYRHARYKGQRNGVLPIAIEEARAFLRPALRVWMQDTGPLS